MITPNQILRYMEDKSFKLEKGSKLKAAIDDLRDNNSEKYLNFYKAMLDFEHPKMQSTTVKQGEVPKVKLD